MLGGAKAEGESMIPGVATETLFAEGEVRLFRSGHLATLNLAGRRSSTR